MRQPRHRSANSILPVRPRQASLAVSILLIAQFGLGMGVNLCVTSPAAGHPGHGSFFSNGPPLAAHAALGTFLTLSAIFVLVIAVRARNAALMATLGGRPGGHPPGLLLRIQVHRLADRRLLPRHGAIRRDRAGLPRRLPVRRQLGPRKSVRRGDPSVGWSCGDPRRPMLAATRPIRRLSFQRAFRRRFGRRRLCGAGSRRRAGGPRLCTRRRSGPSPCSSPSRRGRGGGSPHPGRGQPG